MRKEGQSVDSRIERFYENMDNLAQKAVLRMAGIPKLGTVVSVSGSTARVLIDGDDSPIPAAVFCQGVAAGKRVLVTAKRTEYYITGVRQ